MNDVANGEAILDLQVKTEFVGVENFGAHIKYNISFRIRIRLEFRI